MNKTLLATLAVFAFGAASAPAVFSDSFSEAFAFLTPAERQTLLNQGELTFSGASRSELPMAQKAPFAPEVARGMTLKQATVAIEGVFVFPRPAGNVELALYNAVNAVASMEGVEYYSVSRKRMEPLILASWRVSSQDKPQKISDPVFTFIPPFQRAVVFQKDNKLGEGLSELTWKALPSGGIVMTIRNLQTLNYAFVPLVEPGNLQMLFVLLPLSDKVAVYGVMEGKTAQLFGLERSKDESFRNRMRALAGWLGTRIATLK